MGEHRLSKALTIAVLSLVVLVSGCDGSSGSSSGGSTPTGGSAGGPVLSSSPPAVVGHGIGPSLAVSQDSATVAWVRGYTGRPVRVRTQAGIGSWGPTKTLGLGDIAPAVASNRDGTTVMAWEQRQAGVYRLMVARRPAHRSWQDAVAMYRLPSPREIFDLRVAVSDNGATAIWWDESILKDDPPYQHWSFVSYAAPSGIWQSPHPVVSNTLTSPDTTAAFDNRGDLTVAYDTRAGIRLTQRTSRSWTPPRSIADFKRPLLMVPVLMMTPSGDTLVVAWQDDRGFVARRRTKGRWEPPVLVKQPTGSDVDWHFDAAMDDSGNTTLGWLTLEGSVYAKEWPDGEPVGAEQRLVGPPRGRFAFREDQIDVATGADGDTAISYLTDPPKGAPVLNMLYRPRNAPWGPQRVLLNPGVDYYQLAVRPAGDIDVVATNPLIRYQHLARR